MTRTKLSHVGPKNTLESFGFNEVLFTSFFWALLDLFCEVEKKCSFNPTFSLMPDSNNFQTKEMQWRVIQKIEWKVPLLHQL